jgi:putrescine transport system substrate-binding protein
MTRFAHAAGTALLLVLAACARHGAPSPAPVPNARATDHAADVEKVLNVYTWSDYIAPDTVANFERETGIKVRLDTYDNNEVLETKLLTGHSGYDVVTPSENYFDHQLKAHVYRKLDKSALTNLVHADPDIMRRMAVHDPGNQYAVPYMWATTGIGYNVEQVRTRLGAQIPKSWSLLFDPANAARLKDCGITITDSAIDVFTSSIIALGRDPNRHSPQDLLDASARLRAIRPFVRAFQANPIADLANGDTCLALAWSGDAEMARQRAQQAGRGVSIVYFVPQEGALLLIDMMAIPADAPHPGNAELWMNYLMRPEVAASITNYIRYPNGIKDSIPLLDADIARDSGIYPDPETRARLVTAAAIDADYTRLMTREWTRFRTGQ